MEGSTPIIEIGNSQFFKTGFWVEGCAGVTSLGWRERFGLVVSLSANISFLAGRRFQRASLWPPLDANYARVPFHNRSRCISEGALLPHYLRSAEALLPKYISDVRASLQRDILSERALLYYGLHWVRALLQHPFRLLRKRLTHL